MVIVAVAVIITIIVIIVVVVVLAAFVVRFISTQKNITTIGIRYSY